jgi:hypothetical protein
MATATGVVVIQAADNVKPEQAAEIGPLPIDRSAQFVSKPGLDLTSEPVCCQDTGQLGVEPLAAIGPESYGKTPQNTRYEYCYDFKSHTDKHSLCEQVDSRTPASQAGRSFKSVLLERPMVVDG